MRRTLTATTVTLALLGTSFTLPASATPVTEDRVVAGEQTATKNKKKKRSASIVSPRPGQQVSRHTATVTVQASHGVRKAQLNGTKLRGSEFTIQPGGVRRTAKLSSSHGLRHGANILRVTMNKRYKGTVTKTVRFTVKGKRLLTGAGRDRRIVAGNGVTLKGTAQLHPTMRDRNTTTTWRIVGKPAGSKPVLLRPKSKKPRLRTDLPGQYVVRATSSMGRSAASGTFTTSDTVTVSSAESPMVPFNAWSADGAGNPGISVGGRFYPGSLPLEKSSWQMLVLNRSTLGVMKGDNRTYGQCESGWCVATDGGGPSREADIEEDAKDLGPTDLVVLVHRSQFGQNPRPNPFTEAFGIPKDFLPSGSESGALVLVPGTSSTGAEGSVHTYLRDTAGKADLSGYMMQDRYRNFTFVDDARVPFDTRSKQTCGANSCTATVTVGDVTRTFTATGGQAGLAIMRFDRRTLATRDAQFVLTNGASPDQIRGNMVGATNYLNGIGQDELVFITSVVAPGAVLMGKPSPVIDAQTDEVRFIGADPARALGSAIARLGGSRHRVLQAGVQKNDGYTLVGYPGLTEGQGNESHTKEARFSGVLQRDGAQMFVPRTVVPGPERYDTFSEKVMDPPSQRAWPGEKDPAFMAVLACLADKKSGLSTTNPRSSYWNASSITAKDWNTWYVDVSNKQPSACPGTDPDTFTKAQKVFEQELLWNYYLRSYIESLQAPYSGDAAVQALADTSAWSSELKASSDKVKNSGVKVDWFALFATAIEAVAPFLAPYLGSQASKAAKKLVEEATHALSAATAGALEMGGASLETGESGEQFLQDDEFNVEVGKLGAELVDRILNTAKNLDRMGDVIASDYVKLSAIGNELIECQDDKKADRTPGTDGFTCDPQFFTGDEATLRAEANASQGVQRTIYERVLPLTYPVTYLPWDGKITAGAGRPEGNWDAALFTCFNATPFLPDPPENVDKDSEANYWPRDSKPFLRRSLGQVLDQNFIYALGTNTDIRDTETIPQFDTYVIAAFGNNRFNVDTARETVDKLFGEKKDTKVATEGGLGADAVDFVLEQIAEGKVQDYPLGCGGFANTNDNPAPLDR